MTEDKIIYEIINRYVARLSKENKKLLKNIQESEDISPNVKNQLEIHIPKELEDITSSVKARLKEAFSKIALEEGRIAERIKRVHK